MRVDCACFLKGGKFDRDGKHQKSEAKSTTDSSSAICDTKTVTVHPSLANCDKELVEKIEADIVHKGQAVTFDDISGLEFAKKCVTELICWSLISHKFFIQYYINFIKYLTFNCISYI